jgi:hypothetical protein
MLLTLYAGAETPSHLKPVDKLEQVADSWPQVVSTSDTDVPGSLQFHQNE